MTLPETFIDTNVLVCHVDDNDPRKSDIAHTYLAEILTPLIRVFASIPLYQNALDIQARYRFGFYDSLIVAAALSAGCRQLLTEDLQNGLRIEGLEIRNPFA